MTQLHIEGSRTRVLDWDGLRRSVRRIAHEIREHHTDLEPVIVAGIREGGVPLARMVAAALAEVSGAKIRLAALSVSGFRDDEPRGAVAASDAWNGIDGEPAVTGSVVVIVDDVIQTGRTMRAAFDVVASLGRPAAIEAAVMVDRGGREVPVRPNYVGKNLPVAVSDWVEILIATPDDSGVFVVSR